MNNRRKTYSTVNTLSSEQIYYDLSVANTSIPADPQTNPLIPAKYIEVRDQPILSGNQNEYKMAIVRLDIPSTSVPLFVHYEDFFFVVMDDVDSGITSGNIQVPYIPSSTLPNPTGYPNRVVYNIFNFLKGVNQALDIAFNQMKFNFGTALWEADANRPQIAPFITYENSLFSFNYDVRGSENQTFATDIYFNNNLFYKFLGLPANLVAFNSFDYRDVKLSIYDQYNNTIQAVDPITLLNQDVYKMVQQTSSLNLWYQAYKIVVESKSLNIRNEYTTVFDNNTSLNPNNTGNNNVVRPLITDFDLQIGTDNNNYGRILYFPPGEYRYIDIIGEGPLYKIDLEISILFEDLTLIPVYLQQNESWNAKLLFQKIA